jgi:hypothetical protein
MQSPKQNAQGRGLQRTFGTLRLAATMTKGGFADRRTKIEIEATARSTG